MSQDYLLNFSDPTKAAFVVKPYTSNGPASPSASAPLYAGAVSANTSLILLGKGLFDYGEPIQEDLIHLLENFASPTPPAFPIQGQIWFNNGANTLHVNTSTNTTPIWETVIVNGQLDSDLNVNGRKITGVGDPTGISDAVSLSYANLTYIRQSGGNLTGTLELQGVGAKITTSNLPSSNNDLVNKAYVDDTVLAITGVAVGNYMLISGGTMYGTITFDTGDVDVATGNINVTNGTLQVGGNTTLGGTLGVTGDLSVASARVLTYQLRVDDSAIFNAGIDVIAGNLTVPPLSTTTLGHVSIVNSANVTLNGAVIHNIGTPVAGTDCANKSYVDGVASAIGSLSTLNDVALTAPQPNDILWYTPANTWVNTSMSAAGIVPASHVTQLSNSHVATAIATTPVGGITSTNVQIALQDLHSTRREISTTVAGTYNYEAPYFALNDQSLQVYMDGTRLYQSTQSSQTVDVNHMGGVALNTGLMNDSTLYTCSVTMTTVQEICDVDVGSKIFSISDPKYVSQYYPGSTFQVNGSLGGVNDGTYTVQSTSTTPTLILVTVIEAIPSASISGTVTPTNPATYGVIVEGALAQTYQTLVGQLTHTRTEVVVSASAGANTFTIANDYSLVLTQGRSFSVVTSTSNDGVYTVVSSLYSAGFTTITVLEPVPTTSTNDGLMSTPPPFFTARIDGQNIMLINQTVGNGSTITTSNTGTNQLWTSLNGYVAINAPKNGLSLGYIKSARDSYLNVAQNEVISNHIRLENDPGNGKTLEINS